MEFITTHHALFWSLAGLFGLLISATAIVQVMKWNNPAKDYSELSLRIKSWWIMISVFASALLLSEKVSLAMFGLISFLALKEYFSMIPTRRADRRVLFWAYLAIPLQYYWVSAGWYGMFIIFIPVYMFLLLPTRMLLIGDTRRFLSSLATIHWGLMTLVFSISHVSFLMVLPEQVNPAAGGAGLVLYLVFLTQFNDVAQYVWGKLFGKHKIVPQVSPNKTWAGFLGGVATTTALATALSGVLTPMTFLEGLFAGLIISIAGFLGDITISALKRDIGVKDAGNLLPGHGGMLDRIDSLTFSAPLFFHFIYFLHY